MATYVEEADRGGEDLLGSEGDREVAEAVGVGGVKAAHLPLHQLLHSLQRLGLLIRRRRREVERKGTARSRTR